MEKIKISLFEPNATAQMSGKTNEEAELSSAAELIVAVCGDQPWSPGIFEDGERKNTKLKEISLLVLDVDEGCSIAEAEIQFSGYRYIIATTKSHQKEKNGVICDRFRVILFLDKPVHSDAEFKELWFAAFARWPFIDKACKDTARFYFPCTEVVASEEGKTFSERIATQAPRQQGNGRPAASIQKGKLSRLTKDFLAEGAPAGEWHARLHKAAVDFKEQGFDQDEATSKLAAATTSFNGELDQHDLATIDDVYHNRPSRYGPRDQLVITDWPVTKDGKDGEIIPDLKAVENYRHFLGKVGFQPRLNELDGAIYISGRPINDGDVLDLYLKAFEIGLRNGKEFMFDLIAVVAKESSYHPIKVEIESAKHDGADHIRQLFETITFAPGVLSSTHDFYADCFQKWLVGVVAKLYQPGEQNFVLTFLGEQGIGKSRWLQKLALWAPAFGEGAVDPDKGDHELRHLTHVIWHIPELEYTTGRREAGALKDYLTKSAVSVRPAYARNVRKGLSICSFCASVNSPNFLADPTGNRRFVVFPITAIDANHAVNMPQVFAQAKQLFDSGAKWWLAGEAQATLNELNEDYRPKSEIEMLVETMVDHSEAVAPTLELLFELGIDHPNQGQLREFANLMAKAGYKKDKTKDRKKRGYLAKVLSKPKKLSSGHLTVVKAPPDGDKPLK